MSSAAPTPQTWSWGDLFELDLPSGWVVRDLDDAVEIAPAGSVVRGHLAVLDLESGASEGAVRTLLRNFAAERRVSDPLTIDLDTPRRGLVHGRLPLFDGGLYWVAQVIAWNTHAVLVTLCSPTMDDPVLGAMESWIGGMRPVEIREPVGDWLDPDPPGEF